MPGSSSELLDFDHFLVDLRKLVTTSWNTQHSKTCSYSLHNLLSGLDTLARLVVLTFRPPRSAILKPLARVTQQTLLLVTSWTMLSTTHLGLQHPRTTKSLNTNPWHNLNIITFVSCDKKFWEIKEVNKHIHSCIFSPVVDYSRSH